MSDKYDLVGAKEAADMLGIGTPNFSHLRADEAKKGEDSLFPKPVVVLACGPIWERSEMAVFAETYGKRKPGKAPRTAPPVLAPAAGVQKVRKRLPRPARAAS